MTALSTPVIERSRKAHSAVLQAMQDPGTQRNVALALGVSESTVSRTKSTLEDAITLLYQLGFKVVAQDMKCYPTEYVQALHALARMHMATDTKTLEWE